MAWLFLKLTCYQWIVLSHNESLFLTPTLFFVNLLIPWICQQFTSENGILERISDEGITADALMNDVK